MTSTSSLPFTLVPFVRARSELATLCSRVAFGGERIVLTRNGKPGAALVSMADLERLRSADVDAAVDAAPRFDEVVDIAASRAFVWDAIVSVRIRTRWWPKLSLEPYEGGQVVDDWSRDSGQVLEIVREQLLRMDWSHLRGEVTIRLATSEECTTVAVTHRMEREFWQERLDALRAYVETQS